MVSSAPNSPADPSAASAQMSVHGPVQFPFPKASQRGAECSSSFTEPLSFEQGRSSKEKRLPSGSAMGWGESSSHYLWFVNPSVTPPNPAVQANEGG